MALNPRVEAERLLGGVWADISDRRIPVDPIWIAHHLGIDVYVADMPDNVSGRIDKRPGRDPLIALNRSDSKNRTRFTCAHELGHYVYHSQDEDERFAYTDHRGPLSSKGLDPEEIFANAFAAALLMPEREVRESFEDGATVAEMAYEFQVSIDAMGWRVRNLKLT